MPERVVDLTPSHLWFVFYIYDEWVTTHTLFPLLIAVACGSRAWGLVSSFAYESLTILLFGFGYDMGYSGGIEGLLQDPLQGAIGVCLAPLSATEVRAKVWLNVLLGIALLAAAVLMLDSIVGSRAFVLWINAGGLLPIGWLYLRGVRGSLLRRNENALDIVRIYLLLCLANLVSYCLDASTFLWMLGIVVLPECILIGLSRRRSGGAASNRLSVIIEESPPNE